MLHHRDTEKIYSHGFARIVADEERARNEFLCGFVVERFLMEIVGDGFGFGDEQGLHAFGAD